MDLELQRDAINYFDLVLDTTICQEETQEAIVPDACPDILRILDTRAHACLTGKQVRDGMVTITGLIRTCVFYLPESGNGVRHLEVAMPFTCQSDAQGLTSHGTVLAFPRLRWAEARALNPRKVLLRVDLAVDIRAYQPVQIDLCCGANHGEEHNIHQLLAEENADIIQAVQEKPFTFSDSIDFGFSSGERGEVLSIHGEPHCSESKLIGSKLIFKGSVEIEALICDGGELKTARQSMAYSQIMEISGAGDNCSCEVRIALADLNFQQEEGLSGDGEITLELLAQAVVRENRYMTLLSDLYSTSWQLDSRTETYLLRRTMEQGTRAIPVRELIETTTMVRTVSHCWADLGEVHTGKEGEQIVITAQIQLNAIYLDDGEQLQSVHKTFSVSCRLDAAIGSVCQCWCSTPRELFVSPAAGGLEIRFTLDFHCLVSIDQRVTAVASAELVCERQKGDGTQPSIILRLAAPGERLWDIAKHYGTTVEEITQANELDNAAPPTGKMLLIPRTR